MYAVIISGGKQYRVSEGDTIRLETLPVEAGQEVVFDKVLMINDGKDLKIGAPYVDGGKVQAQVVEHGRGKKIEVVKFKRRKNYLKRQGHRQNFTAVKIEKISA